MTSLIPRPESQESAQDRAGDLHRIEWLSPTRESIVVKSIHILPQRPLRQRHLVHKTDAKDRNGTLVLSNFGAI